MSLFFFGSLNLGQQCLTRGAMKAVQCKLLCDAKLQKGHLINPVDVCPNKGTG